MSTILVPLDTSPFAQQALPTAGAIAKAARGKLRLILVHERQPFAGYADAPWNGAREAMEGAYLADTARELEKELGIDVTVDHPCGPAAETIVRHANAYRADLVVMTTHGRTGLSRAWFGSVADSVMRNLDIPLLLLHPTEGAATASAAQAKFRRVMIPLDGTPQSEEIIDAAVSLAGTRATYVLARVVVPVPLVSADFGAPYSTAVLPIDATATDILIDDARRYLDEVASRLAGKGAIKTEQSVRVSDHAGPVLLDVANAYDIDLIAIATHGRGVSRFVLGSVADKLLRGSKAALLITRMMRQ